MGCASSSSAMKYDDYDWDELPIAVKVAAETLGYNKKLWDQDKDTEYSDYDWNELSEEQRKAAAKLGYTQKIWDSDA